LGSGLIRNALEDTLQAAPEDTAAVGPPANAAQPAYAVTQHQALQAQPVPPAGPAAAHAPADPLGTATAPTTPLASSDRYRLGAELGRGGMGRVVEAFDLQLGRTVAFKEVLPRGGPSIARRFLREVQLTARLEHPSIIPLYDAGTTADGRPFYVMRRVTGQPLDQLMAQAADLGERLTLLPALLAAINAVAHAHHRGVIHRDLKPANILVGRLGETVVIDWGLAKVIGEDDDKPGQLLAQASDSLRTQMGSVFGTPGFMAPEQARGEELDPRGDVYALGAILYQLLAGAPPHSGTSATEVIANTGSREVTPVNVKAPGAPADLVAIVGKALAFDAAGRYPDAGALGEDVRRFLAGQLVAAHHYTRRQHVARFARRHRAPLAVAALAMVAVAVLAWIGVHRIVQERDTADAARAQAVAQRAETERAKDALQRRADQLVVSEARGLLDKNPTHTAAVLKDIPDRSERIAEARAVAQAAIVRGTAWTMQLTDDLTVYAELSADAKFLLQVTRDGTIRVWDLDHRRLVVARPYPKDVRATWAGASVFVTPGHAAPELLDPFAGPVSGTIQQLAIGPATWAVATAKGDRIAYLDPQHAAYVLDVATRATHPLWPGHAVAELEIAADGSWIALADKAAVEVVDAAGHELTARPLAAVRIIGSRFGSLAVQTADKVVMCTLAPEPVWTELEFSKWAPGQPIDVEFRGRELDTFVSTGKVVAWNGQRQWERLILDGFTFRMAVAGDDLLVVPGTDGQLHLSNDLVTGALHLPVPLTALKVYARAGAPRIVALGRGMLVGFELGDNLPQLLRQPAGTMAAFVDDDTLLLWRAEGGSWQWYDVRSGRATPFDYDAHGLIEVVDVDPSDGRVLVRETAIDTALYLLRKTTPERRMLVRGAHVWGHLMPHDALIFGVGDGRLFGVRATRRSGDPGAAVPREIVKLAGFTETAVGFGDTGYAAIATSGELVRGDLATQALARTHVAPGTTGAIAVDPAGRVLLGEDNHLLVWDRDVVEIARLDQPITRIVPVERGALLELADHAVVRTTLVAGAPMIQVLAASDQAPLVSGDGHLVIGQSVNNQLVAVEIAAQSQSAWELPVYYTALGLLSISPTTRRFVQSGFAQLALWTLPVAPAELHTWLDERTNALVDDHHALTWPWQLPMGPAHPMPSPVHPSDP
jgi:hypothetical protein